MTGERGVVFNSSIPRPATDSIHTQTFDLSSGGQNLYRTLHSLYDWVMANDLVKDSGKVLERYEGNTLPSLMASQHPIHGLFGAAFEEIGGHERLKEWAKENYGDFIKIFSKMAPPPSPKVSVSNMKVEISSALQKPPIEGETE